MAFTRVSAPFVTRVATAGILLLLSTQALAQVGLSGINRMLYGNGDVRLSTGNEASRIFREEVLDVGLSWQDFHLNLAGAVYHPSEYPDGRVIQDQQIREEELIRRSLEWQGPLLIRVGHTHTTFGNGLALSLYRDDQLENPLLTGTTRKDTPTTWDNAADGAFVEYSGSSFSVKALYGESDYYGVLHAANAEFYHPWAMLGVSWVAADDVIQDPVTMSGQHVESMEAYIDGSLGPLAYSYNYMGQRLLTGEKNAGDGGLASYATLGAELYGWYLQLSHKYYRMAGEKLMLNNPPIVQQEIPTKLIARKRKQTNYQDETGLQLDVSRYFNDGAELQLTGAWASRIDDGSPLPVMEESFAAYQEYTGRYSRELSGSRHLTLTAAYTEETAQAGDGNWYRKTGLGGSYLTPVTALLLPGNMEFSAELMRKENLDDDHKTTASLVYLDYFPWTILSLNLTADYEEESESGDDWVYSGELRVDFKTGSMLDHSLTAFVGDVRGGLVCSSGNCRLVNPFSGYRLLLETRF